MLDILIKALGFILIIVIGFLLKSKGICKREHGQFLSTIIMNITLPCALLSSINNLEITPILLITLLIGFLGNIITNIAGYIITPHEKPIDRALTMINTSGYNIGTFTLPFVQSFFPASAIAYVCLFDTGNALMCLGGTFTAASTVVSSDEKPSFQSIIKKLFSSIPFCTYIVLFFLSLFHITIPKQILSVTSIAGNANAFLAMLMIGILLEVKLDFSQIKTIKKIIFTRYSLSFLLSIIVYFLLPLDIVVRKMIVLCLFAPVSAVAPVFSSKLGSSSPVPAAVNSISIIISIVALTSLILLFA
ncbi:MAG: AEC family transporter [Longibaculum sp.]